MAGKAHPPGCGCKVHSRGGCAPGCGCHRHSRPKLSPEEARERREEVRRVAEVALSRRRAEERRRKALAQIEALRAELAADEYELRIALEAESRYQEQSATDLAEMTKSRRA